MPYWRGALLWLAAAALFFIANRGAYESYFQDDDLDNIAGKRDQLEGKTQERYGIVKDQVRKDIDTWYGTQKW